MMINRVPVSKYSAWAALVVCCSAICAIHLITLKIDPTLFQDEVQIIDFGRTSIDPTTSWAISWNIQEGIPVLTPSYLASTIQERAFKLSEPSNLGPRSAAMIGAVIATLCLFGWLRARDTPQSFAFFLAIAFFIDPIFSDIYRQGRVDGYAIAACLAACWLIRAARSREACQRPIRNPLVGAGFLLSAAPFLWLSTPILFPLAALEIFRVLEMRVRTRPAQKLSRMLAPVFFPFIAGCIVGLTLFSLPLLSSWEYYLHGLTSAAAVQARAAEIQNPVIDLFLANDPALVVVLLVSLVIRREIGLLLALVGAVALILNTMIYLPRILYLLPYAFAIIGGACTQAAGTERRSIAYPIMGRAMAALLIWNTGSVLLVRPYAAHQQWPANDPDQFLAQFEQHIGPGDYRVLLEAWEGYYAARSLGWHIFRAGSPLAQADYLEFAKTMDYLVLPQKQALPQIDKSQLIESGFELQATIVVERNRKAQIGWGRLSLRLPETVYSDLLIYRNTVGGKYIDSDRFRVN